MGSPYVFTGTSRYVAAFLKADDSKPITIYPNSHDAFDSISIQWSKSTADAERLAHDLLGAVRAIRAHGLPCPKCLAEAGKPCAKDNPEEITEPAHAERLEAYDRQQATCARVAGDYGATGTATLAEVQPDAE